MTDLFRLLLYCILTNRILNLIYNCINNYKTISNSFWINYIDIINLDIKVNFSLVRRVCLLVILYFYKLKEKTQRRTNIPKYCKEQVVDVNRLISTGWTCFYSSPRTKRRVQYLFDRYSLGTSDGNLNVRPRRGAVKVCPKLFQSRKLSATGSLLCCQKFQRSWTDVERSNRRRCSRERCRSNIIGHTERRISMSRLKLCVNSLRLPDVYTRKIRAVYSKFGSVIYNEPFNYQCEMQRLCSLIK